MLKSTSLLALQKGKNLLAFSGGVDSTALFFLLLDANISFDIAIVDYNTRAQSKEELAYAQALASKFHLQCFVHSAPRIEKNFEAKARDIRYTFFETLCKEHHYTNLITAHHLGDRFEWMLMQFCKGAGCVELSGMQESETRQDYTLIRPLLHLQKTQLYSYLQERNIKYFEDASNKDESLERNYFRHNISEQLLQKYASGIEKSFSYLEQDKQSLLQDVELHRSGKLVYFPSTHNKRADIHAIDSYLKSISYMLSASERAQLHTQTLVQVGRRFFLSQAHNYVFIVPYDEKEEVPTLTKSFKEECRSLHIHAQLRPFFARDVQAFTRLQELLQ